MVGSHPTRAICSWPDCPDISLGWMTHFERGAVSVLAQRIWHVHCQQSWPAWLKHLYCRSLCGDAAPQGFPWWMEPLLTGSVIAVNVLLSFLSLPFLLHLFFIFSLPHLLFWLHLPICFIFWSHNPTFSLSHRWSSHAAGLPYPELAALLLVGDGRHCCWKSQVRTARGRG